MDPRTMQRWKAQGVGDDRRAGPKTPPTNKLSGAERREVLEVVNRPEHRDLSVKQIVPRLADQGVYVASESTMYRILREEKQLQHRAASRPPTRSRPEELVATAPNQVWSWDITYLKSPVLGIFFYLYLVVDIFSRKIVGAAVYETEDSEHATEMLIEAFTAEGIDADKLRLHSDNGSPMKGATLLATLQELGVVPSFSRPRVSDDNPDSEALFRTAKYRPEYPGKRFATVEEAREWVTWFVDWYNNQHRHSEISFVTPGQRHAGEAAALLANRQEVYEAARKRHPERWTRGTRAWSRPAVVRLNPQRTQAATEAA